MIPGHSILSSLQSVPPVTLFSFGFFSLGFHSKGDAFFSGGSLCELCHPEAVGAGRPAPAEEKPAARRSTIESAGWEMIEIT